MHDADQPAESLQASVQGPHRPSILSPWLTAVYGLFVGVYLGLAIIPASSSRLDQLDHPEDSLERLVSRDLDMRDALRRAADWKRALYVAFAGPEDPLGDAIVWYDEVAGVHPAPLTPLYRLLLLGEDGQLNRVGAALVPWEFQGASQARMAKWVRAAYLVPALDRETGRALVPGRPSGMDTSSFAGALVARWGAEMGARG